MHENALRGKEGVVVQAIRPTARDAAIQVRTVVGDAMAIRISSLRRLICRDVSYRSIFIPLGTANRPHCSCTVRYFSSVLGPATAASRWSAASADETEALYSRFILHSFLLPNAISIQSCMDVA